jgi:hypothetical protein
MNALKSKTIWFSIILAIGGILEQSQGIITQLIGPQNGGLLMMAISMIVAVLRVVTTQPLSDK